MKNRVYLFKSIRVFFLLFMLLGLTLHADVRQLEKDGFNEIRMSEKMMHKKNINEAKNHMEKAKEIINSIKEQDPKNRTLRRLQMKYDRHQKQLDRKMKSASSSASSSSKSSTNSSAKSTSSKKLPGGVKHRLKKVDKFLDEVEAGSNYRLVEIDRLMDEIFNQYGSKVSSDHPELKSRKDRIANAKAGADGAKKQKAQAQQASDNQQKAVKELSDRWLVKIRPYIALGPDYPGYDETKHLVSTSTKKMYKDALDVHNEYLKEDFSTGQTSELKEAARQFKYSLESLNERHAAQDKNLGKTIDEKISFSNKRIKDRVSKDDGKTPPLPLQKEMIPEIKDFIAKAEKKGIDKGKLSSWKKQIANLEKENNKLIKLKIERTVMITDQFGNDQEALDLKASAVKFMKNDRRSNNSNVKALRTTIIKDRWAEKRAWEYTDTTKTKLVHRVTRSIRAQIAGKLNGKVFLYWINISKDLQSGGKWGPLNGHVMYRDEMLEKNVNK